MQVYAKCNRTGAFVFEDDETEDEAPPLPIMAILIGVIIVIVIIIISRKAYSYWRQKDEHVRYVVVMPDFPHSKQKTVNRPRWTP